MMKEMNKNDGKIKTIQSSDLKFLQENSLKRSKENDSSIKENRNILKRKLRNR